jgi:anti-sigma factor RsiW
MTDRLVPPTSHLSEAERQCAADGTLGDDDRAAVTRHLAECDECAADVARLRAFIARAQERTAAPGDLDDLWPAIRARIEEGKVIALEARDAAAASTTRRAPRVRGQWWLLAGAVAAAAILAITLHRPPRQTAASAGQPPAPAGTVQRGGRAIVQVSDSARAYQQQISALLEELELRRSMLQPQTAATVDHDLRLIDSAIVELQEALKHDPDNAALRQLLAASYRQKRDLLRSLDNAS